MRKAKSSRTHYAAFTKLEVREFGRNPLPVGPVSPRHAGSLMIRRRGSGTGVPPIGGQDARPTARLCNWRRTCEMPYLVVILALALMTFVTTMSMADTQGSDRKKDLKAITRDGAAALGSKPQALGEGELYALVVGVSKYQEPRLRLDFAAKDAKDFAAFLETQKKVFRDTHVKVMVDQQATKREVEKYLFHDLLKAGKNDTVILFFSGHGGTDPAHPNQFYFLTSDAEPEHLEATSLNMTGLRSFERIDSKRVLLIADACHAGMPASLKTKAIDPPLEKYMQLFHEASGRVILASSKPEELSQEKPNLQNSVFTYYLLRGLNGEADLNRDGIITVDEAYDYVYERTKGETRGAQHPQKLGSVVGHFPISMLGKLGDTVKLDVWFVAQDPRCMNSNCIDPPPGVTECKDPLCGDTTITNGSSLYSGQNYQIGFRPHARNYVYVYQIDSKGQIARLFPGTDYLDPGNRLDNPLEGDRIYWLPARDRWLFLDQNEGKEKIYVVASRSRNARLEDLYKHLEEIRKGGGETRKAEQVKEQIEDDLKSMGPATSNRKKITRPASPGIASGKSASFEELSSAIESAGLDTVKAVWFHHKGQRPWR